jgi:hypothetical protein
VWCAFPEIVETRGAKKRPALVVRVSPATHEVAVVYGTTQKTDKLYPSEIALDTSDAGFATSGLAYRTKFDLSQIVQLPFDSVWFGPAPGRATNSPPPKMGTLHPSYFAAMHAALKTIKR